ncbi:MAG: class I SAM-dependent methyltransferase [Cyanothece sp. SIO1E1]|nr:class I SAM-dependent methyltransferase [Cyanothece sp. SIO1E1]
MLDGGTDQQWEKYGKRDPYFGVIRDEKYCLENLNGQAIADFFKSGEDYIDYILKLIKQHLDPDFSPQKAVDFGCGVGRLVMPLARRSQQVVGMDVSEAMLAEAMKNCDAHSFKNVDLIKSDDNLTQLQGQYNLIHSYIVFQHIPVKRGERIFAQLLEHLAPNGIGVFHFTYAKSHPLNQIRSLVQAIPFSYNLLNLIKGRDFSAPYMQMNTYNLNRLLLILQKSNIQRFYTEFKDHGGELGVLLFFQK